MNNSSGAERPPPTSLAFVGRAAGRFELFDAFSCFWQRAARRQPMLLILDDLHWADPTSLRLLAFIAGQLDGQPLCVLSTCRDDARPRAHPLSEALADLTRSATFQRLTMGGLSAGETAQFVASAAGADEVATSASPVVSSTSNCWQNWTARAVLRVVKKNCCQQLNKPRQRG